MGTRILTSDAKLGDDSKDAQNCVVQRSDSAENTDSRPEARSTYLCSDYGDVQVAENEKGNLESFDCKDRRVW